MDTKEKCKSLQELVDELNIDLLDDSIVKSNKLPFLHQDELYQVKMPTQEDLTLAKAVEDDLKIKLLLNKNKISRANLIKVLKENQNIDIFKLETKKDDYANKLREIYMLLATTSDKEIKRIEKLKNSLDEVKQEFMELSVEISNHLSVSIENQVEIEYIKYLTVLCTEKLVDKKWKLVWSTQGDFKKDRTGLPNKANLCFSRLFLTARSS